MKNELTIIQTSQAPAAIGPYSQAVAAGGFLFCSGQIPLDPVTMAVAGSDPVTQARQALTNLKAVLEAGGSSLDRVVRVGLFLKDMGHFARVNEIYTEFFGNHKPARTTVEVSRLPKDVLVEVEAVGVVG